MPNRAASALFEKASKVVLEERRPSINYAYCSELDDLECIYAPPSMAPKLMVAEEIEALVGDIKVALKLVGAAVANATRQADRRIFVVVVVVVFAPNRADARR